MPAAGVIKQRSAVVRKDRKESGGAEERRRNKRGMFGRMKGGWEHIAFGGGFKEEKCAREVR